MPIYGATSREDDANHTPPTSFTEYVETKQTGTSNTGSQSAGYRNDIASSGGSGTFQVNFGQSDRASMVTAILKAHANP